MIIIALMLALVGKTNDDIDPDEYVVDADEWDQQPSGERDKATSP